MKKSWIRRFLYVIFAIAAVIIIAGAVKTGIDKYKDKQPTPNPDTAQVQVVELAA